MACRDQIRAPEVLAGGGGLGGGVVVRWLSQYSTFGFVIQLGKVGYHTRHVFGTCV